MTTRENIIKAVRFDTPESIPLSFHINSACWNHYPQEALIELKASHPVLFPDFKPPSGKIIPDYGPHQRAGKPFMDDWHCLWETAEDGITGVVTKHPLEDWSALQSFVPPDPECQGEFGPRDWKKTARDLEQARQAGRLARGGLNHGHTFLRLCDLRGYQNLLCDMFDEDPRLPRLVRMVEDYNTAVVKKYLELGVEWMSYPEDLGMQSGPMLSPEHFRRYIKPVYQRLIAPAREKGVIVHMHSDGDIRTLAGDLIAGGVEVLNLQDLVNGIDWIAANLAGKVCIDLDIDRQRITPRGTPRQIEALVREEVEKLATKRGGLMMIYGLYPGVPLENIKALMDAMDRYSDFYS